MYTTERIHESTLTRPRTNTKPTLEYHVKKTLQN